MGNESPWVLVKCGWAGLVLAHVALLWHVRGAHVIRWSPAQLGKAQHQSSAEVCCQSCSLAFQSREEHSSIKSWWFYFSHFDYSRRRIACCLLMMLFAIPLWGGKHPCEYGDHSVTSSSIRSLIFPDLDLKAQLCITLNLGNFSHLSDTWYIRHISLWLILSETVESNYQKQKR